MTPFKLSKKAYSDLKQIAASTLQAWGREQRRHYLKQLDDAFHLLADSPGLGASCDYILPGYKKHPQGSHIIFYRQIDSAPIEIIRILHKRMDVPTKLQEDL